VIQESYHYDEAADRLVVKRTQDVEPILDYTKAIFDADNTRWDKVMNHVARIPLVVVDEYKRRGIDLLKDDAALKRFLNDPDNKLFRTKPGVI